jgi:6,7-dimethyl-8-ribityllumazine synthase
MNKQPGTVYEGHLNATGLRVAIVCARFNEFFVARLLEGAVDHLVRHGVATEDIVVAWVPGSFEIPLIARRFATSGKYQAVIALGVVIQGATAHAQFINNQVAAGIAGLMAETGVPVVYGVVTTEDLDQAIERSGTKHGNRGSSAANTAIEMANLLRAMES